MIIMAKQSPKTRAEELKKLLGPKDALEYALSQMRSVEGSGKIQDIEYRMRWREISVILLGDQ